LYPIVIDLYPIGKRTKEDLDKNDCWEANSVNSRPQSDDEL
jgi:hypothetical protein